MCVWKKSKAEKNSTCQTRQISKPRERSGVGSRCLVLIQSANTPVTPYSLCFEKKFIPWWSGPSWFSMVVAELLVWTSEQVLQHC